MYKQFKGGNDDLRQDAIMEQVFDEVSKMLQNHKATRQRNINIRTYKVLPLTSNTGIIEFVPNSVPLAEFLNPAHRKYHPGDLKQDQARSKIAEVAKMTKEVRIKTYKEVAARYQPVLRHFFFELFYDPDEWFQRRLAYTRSTAAISILGHVLGLGDRHTQNILLDEKSGEVIHIDLGVAFEAGRVLPIPEVVPFRLSRDIVDGMGITKTEGVFRRCCEFTMEALREEADGIMTLLNVLRYDPLYTWTLSPLRAKRIQEAQEETEDGLEVPGSKRREDEASEADRALSVVEKKLSKTLSVAATVNELIQQASDERNLAVLFAGKSDILSLVVHETDFCHRVGRICVDGWMYARSAEDVALHSDEIVQVPKVNTAKDFGSGTLRNLSFLHAAQLHRIHPKRPVLAISNFL